MEGQGAEIASAEAAPVVGDGKAHFRNGRHAPFRCIHGMPGAGVGQVVYPVQLFPFQRGLRRVHHQHPVSVVFHQRLAVDGVVVIILYPECVRIRSFIGFQLVIIVSGIPSFRFFGILRHMLRQLRQELIIPRHREEHLVPGLPQPSRPPHVPDFLHRHALVQQLRQPHHRPLAHAVHENIRPGVHQHRPAHLVVPVIVVGEPPERGFQPADENGHVPIGFPDPVAVDDHRPVRPFSRLASGGIVVLTAAFFGSGIVGHHGVDIPGGHKKPKPGSAEPFEVLAGGIVRLGQHCAGKPTGFQHTGNDGGAEGGMIHVCVAVHVDKIRLFVLQFLSGGGHEGGSDGHDAVFPPL